MIHTYRMGGYNIVLDTFSGSVHVVDDVAYRMIELLRDEPSQETLLQTIRAEFPAKDEAEIAECFEQIRSLRLAGQLFAPDTFRPLADKLKDKNKGVVKALCLHIAHSCNLACAYCFAGQGKYHGQSALMSVEVGKQALDFLIANSGARTNLEVDFFGGEPTLAMDVVRELVSYARSREKETKKRFRFTLTTNGLLIDDDLIDFVNREMSNVVLSLDGRKEIHDRYRVDHAGRGSWDKVVPKFQRLVAARGGKNYYMRGTFTHANPDFLEDVKCMLDLGFTELSMEPVVCDPASPSALTQEDLPVVLRQYEDLAALMLARFKEGRPFTFYHYMIDLTDGPCVYKRISGCGSGTEYMAVTPTGDLYPCHQFVGEEQFLLGNVWEGVTHPERQQPFADCNVYAHPECRDCWAQLYCSGGCAANAYHATGKVTGVYEYGCTLFRKRMECAIYLQIAEQLEGKNE